jgi:DNA polymerase-3 subunit epsilon
MTEESQRQRFLDDLFGVDRSRPAAGQYSNRTTQPPPNARSPLAEVPLVFLDLETTGLDPWTGDRVCEIAAVRFSYGRETGRLHTLLNPERPVSPGALAVNQLDEAELAMSPRFVEVADELHDLMAGAAVVAHNAPFDAGFIARELKLLGLPTPQNQLLDTLLLSRRVLRSPNYRLGTLAATLGIRTPAHRALADALTTRELFEHIVRKHLAPNPTLADVLRAQGGVVQWPRG